MKKYKVVIQNVDATEDSDTKNIQFFAGGKLCNFPENTPVIISEHAYQNLKDTVQVRYKWDPDLQKMIPYNYKRYPMTLMEVIDVPDESESNEVKVETVVETPMGVSEEITEGAVLAYP